MDADRNHRALIKMIREINPELAVELERLEAMDQRLVAEIYDKLMGAGLIWTAAIADAMRRIATCQNTEETPQG